MPSVTETAFNAIRDAYLPANPDIDWKYGAEHVHDNIDAPRVRGMAMAAVYAPIDRAATAKPASGEIVSIYTKRYTLLFHVWMADEETLEAVVDNIVIAARGLYGLRGQQFRPVNEQRLRSQNEDISARGVYSLLTIELVFEVTNDPAVHDVRAFTSHSHTGTFGPDDEVGC